MNRPGRLRRWLDKATPSRESIEGNRWLRPFAKRVMHSSLWRFTRRSVPRGVALGMVTGILIPMGQIPASAVLALPFRANIPAAAATTFFTNPVTTPPLWLFAYWLGSQFVGQHGARPHDPALQQGWGEWLLNDAAPTLVTGLVAVTIVLAVLGYLVTALGWRLWIAQKWRRRQRERAARSIDAA